MSRSGRDERDQAAEPPQFGRVPLSQGPSGGVASTEANQEPSRNCPNQKPISEPQSRSIPFREREQLAALSRSRDIVFVRKRSYRVSSAERELMTQIGKFRTIAVQDLARQHYPCEADKLRQDLLNLKSQKLVRQWRGMAGKGQEKLLVLLLTKEGKRLVQQECRTDGGQQFYAGFVRPWGVAHDAAIYRMYQAEAAQIEKRGGTIKRVVLDCELMKNVYRPLAKARDLPPLEYARRQAEVAADNRLKVIDGKILRPDLRIEYETAEGELAKVDLELVTEHYHGAHAAVKLKAGFKVYADRASASRLNASLTYGRGSSYEGPELIAPILSL
jgi:hypothetical protein